MADGRFDSVLLGLSQSHSGIEDLLHTVFSFLHRKTDFYVVDNRRPRKMGFEEGQAEALVLKAFRAFPYHMAEPQAAAAPRSGGGGGGGGGGGSSSSSTKSRSTVSAPTPAPTAAAGGPAATKPTTSNASKPATAAVTTPSPAPAPQVAIPQVLPAPPVATPAATPAEDVATKDAEDDEQDARDVITETDTRVTFPGGRQVRLRYNAKGEQIPVDNGGVGPGYWWTQTIDETTVYCNVPEGTKSKDVICTFGSKSVQLKLRDGTDLLSGETEHPVKAGDCMWSLESGSCIVLTLPKTVRTWWRYIVKGHPPIDATKVDSTLAVSEYDLETQAAIRKIMFDQQQKARGLPTSEQIQAQRLFEAAQGAPGSPFQQ